MSLNSVTVSLVILLLQSKNLCAFGFATEHVVISNYTVEEGKSIQFKCDSQAKAPFYYYKFIMENINPPIRISDTRDEFPWSVYNINSSDCSSNLRNTLSFLAISEHPLNVSDITMEFNNVLVCCQGYQTNQSENWQENDQNVMVLSVMRCYRINVQFSPLQPKDSSFEKWVTTLNPSYNQRFVMSCPLKGNPPASYQWYFKKSPDDDLVLMQSPSSLNIKLLNNNRTLYFEELKEEHDGYYVCSAKNFLGSKIYSFQHLLLQVCSNFNANPSVTINASHNLDAFVGDDLIIECIVASLSNFQAKSGLIRWYKNNSQIYETSPTYHAYYELSNFDKTHCRKTISLYIRNLTLEDSGNYICKGIGYDSLEEGDTMLLTVKVPAKQPNYKSLIIEISVPVSIAITLLGILVTSGIFYYLHMRNVKLQDALEEYYKRPLPKKGDYKYDFFFAMIESDKDKLEVDKLYVELKQSFSIYYQLDQYLPGRTKVEMVTEGIKNSRFIIMLLSKAYLQQRDEIARLELIYTMNRIQKELTKCAFIIPLEDNLYIPYNLRHITKFSKESASIKLKELALSSEANFAPFEDSGSVDAIELEAINENDALI